MNTPYPAPRPLDRTGLRVYNLGVQRAVRAYAYDQAVREGLCTVCGRVKTRGDDHWRMCAKCRKRAAARRARART